MASYNSAAADSLDEQFVAYAVSPVSFDLHSEPFLFWYDETCPNVDAWAAFDFPLLLVGPSSSFTSYSATGIGDVAQVVSDAGDWIEFGVWANEHRHTGSLINASGAQVFDSLCAHCDLTSIHTHFDDCFAEEDVESFCVNDVCDGLGTDSDAGNIERSQITFPATRRAM